jgi:K+-transporting ATPase A subunit
MLPCAGHHRANLRRIPARVIVIVGGLIYFPMLILGPIGVRIVG